MNQFVKVLTPVVEPSADGVDADSIGDEIDTSMRGQDWSKSGSQLQLISEPPSISWSVSITYFSLDCEDAA